MVGGRGLLLLFCVAGIYSAYLTQGESECLARCINSVCRLACTSQHETANFPAIARG